MTSTKSTLRKQFQLIRSSLSNSLRQTYSRHICELLLNDETINTTRYLAVYFPSNNEVDLLYLYDSLISKVSLLFPRYNAKLSCYELAQVHSLDTDFCTGPFNIQEPRMSCQRIDTQAVTLWLIPGLAFDSTGNRLGYGKGIYDKLLKGSAAPKWGISYQCQYTDQLPQEPHDVVMDRLITEQEL